MWRTPSPVFRKGRQIFLSSRQLVTEPPKQNTSQTPPPASQTPQPPLKISQSKSKSSGFRPFKFIGFGVPAAVGGILGYAVYDADFRKQLEDNVPYAKELFESLMPPDEASTERKQKNELPFQKSSIGQVEAVKGSLQDLVPALPVCQQLYISGSYLHTYATAYCSTQREAASSAADENPFGQTEGSHTTSLPDLYASYIHSTLNKPHLYQQTNILPAENDDSEEEDDDDDDEDEDDECDDREGASSSFQPKPKRMSDKRRAYVMFDDCEEKERRLAEEISANRSSIYNIFTAPEVAQSQKFQVFQDPKIQDLLKKKKRGDRKNEEEDVYDDDNDIGGQAKTATAGAKEKTESAIAALKKRDKASPSTQEAPQQRPDDDKGDNAALEVVIHKLITNSQNLIAEVVKAQEEVVEAIRNQAKLLKQAMEDNSDVLVKDSHWEAVTIAHKERELAMMRASELLAESTKSVAKLRDLLEEGKNNQTTQNNPAIVPALKQYYSFVKDLENANYQVRQAEMEGNVMQKYRDLAEEGKNKFKKEIESLIPGVKFSSGRKLSEDELNTLIAHAHRRIEQLQKQVAEQMSLERQRLSAALEAQRQEDLKVANTAVAEERKRLQAEFNKEKSKLDTDYLGQLENEVRKQLARQAAAHSDHLKDVLATQRDQLSAVFNQTLHLKMLDEREKFQSQVSGWVSRLKDIEAAVEGRAIGEKLARYAQDLWLACIELNSTLSGHSNIFDDAAESNVIPLRNSVELILEAGHKHPFVETVAGSFPTEALARGVSTEDELKQRFQKVSTICRRLGLVDAANSSLYKYIISYLHSFLVLDNVLATVDGDEVDLTTLDNFALLSHAQYWMDKGNMDIALRFMIQLTGESRRAASDWIEEAKLLLETKQVAETLRAYATASGLANTM